MLKALGGVVRAAGIRLHLVAAHGPDEFEGVFPAMRTGEFEATEVIR